MHHGTLPHTLNKIFILKKQLSRPEAKSLSLSGASGCSVAYAPLGVTNVKKSDLTGRNETRRSFHRKSDKCKTAWWKQDARLDRFVNAKLLDGHLNNTNSSSISSVNTVICAIYTRTQICYVPFYYLLVWFNVFCLFAYLYFHKNLE